jgi:transcriptional regulator of NAD metabolism
MAALRKKKTLSEMAEGSLKKLQAIEVNVRKDRQEFLRELFREQSDPIELIKKKDLHDLLEEALSRMSEITQILARVLLKNT